MKIRKKEIKLFLLFVGNMIVFVENFKESTKKKDLELISELSKVTRYKMNI